MKKHFLFLLALMICRATAADQLLVLSGGGSPLTNHYSQYLQTKTLFNDLNARFPHMKPSVLFGAGNRTGSELVLADTHRLVKNGELSFHELKPGIIDGNVPATLANLNAYFTQPSLKQMSGQETMFLFVSDHGMPFVLPNGQVARAFDNNCIEMWNFRADLRSGTVAEGPSSQRCLSKERLRGLLTTQVSAGRVVFAMTQCFSGGFHMMSVTAKNNYPSANPRICGFTAVPEDTIASGCTPDVDGPGYQGYERSFTEHLTGVDVVTGHRLRPARISLQDAHREATLEDVTKDIPLATSDFYLWKWALAIAKNSFVPRTSVLKVHQVRALIEQALIGQRQSESRGYKNKERFFTSAQKALDLYPEYRAIFAGPLSEHVKLEGQLDAEVAEAEQTLGVYTPTLQVSQSALLNEWHKAVAAGLTRANAVEKAIENKVYGGTDADTLVLLSMSVQSVTVPPTARILSDYQGKRESYALEYAKRNLRKDLRDLALAIEDLKVTTAQMEERYTELMKKHGHVRRLLIYRQVLGAYNALEKMDDKVALKELEGLLECEMAELK